MSGRIGASNRRLAWALGARCRSRGAALLLTMFLVAVIGILLAVAGPVWRTEMQRDKEAELLWVGDEYARAIARYYAASPPPMLQYPEKLGQLLLDVRQPNTVRHLRRLYRDPLTGSSEWGLIKDGGGRVTGVYSLGKGMPLKQGGFEKAKAKFNDAKSYADWTFVAAPVNAAPVNAGPGNAGPGNAGLGNAGPGNAGPGNAGPAAIPAPVSPGGAAGQPMP
jgi:type II secretory pathway pseudopilin PulG